MYLYHTCTHIIRTYIIYKMTLTITLNSLYFAGPYIVTIISHHIKYILYVCAHLLSRSTVYTYINTNHIVIPMISNLPYSQSQPHSCSYNRTPAQVHIHVHSNIHIHVGVYVYIYKCMHFHIHMHTYIFILTQNSFFMHACYNAKIYHIWST